MADADCAVSSTQAQGASRSGHHAGGTQGCDALLVEQIQCATSTLKDCPANWNWDEIENNPFWCPDAAMAPKWEEFLDATRKAGSSCGAVVEVVAEGVPAGWGAPIYGKLEADIAAALMSINAVKGVEIGDGFASAELTGDRKSVV